MSQPHGEERLGQPGHDVGEPCFLLARADRVALVQGKAKEARVLLITAKGL